MLFGVLLFSGLKRRRGEGKKKGWERWGGKLQTKHKKGDRRRIRRKERGKAETSGRKTTEQRATKTWSDKGCNGRKEKKWLLSTMVRRW